MAYCRYLLVVSVFCSFHAFGQESPVEQAKQRAEAYSLEAAYGLDEYLMTAEISVESSPDSDLLFTSKSSMETLHTKDLFLESFSCRPTILSDDRPNTNDGKGGVLDYGPFARLENWERLNVDGKVYDLIERGKRIAPDASRPVHDYIISTSTMCMRPFDWPIHGPNSFNRRSNERDFYKLTFGADRDCVFARGKGELFETHWAKTFPNTNAIQAITFKGDLPVSAELRFFAKPIDHRSYNLEDGKLLVKTDTTWTECGNSYVPKTVVSKIHGLPGKQLSILLMVKMSIITTGDEQFEKRKEQVKSFAAKLANTK